jgi:hypothetical protein
VYNACRETQAERVLDKERSNFCDFFRFRGEGAEAEHRPDPPSAAREAIEGLFRKTKS